MPLDWESRWHFPHSAELMLINCIFCVNSVCRQSHIKNLFCQCWRAARRNSFRGLIKKSESRERAERENEMRFHRRGQSSFEIIPAGDAAGMQIARDFLSSYLSGEPIVMISLIGPRNGKCRGPGILLICLTWLQFIQVIMPPIKQSHAAYHFLEFHTKLFLSSSRSVTVCLQRANNSLNTHSSSTTTEREVRKEQKKKWNGKQQAHWSHRVS